MHSHRPRLPVIRAALALLLAVANTDAAAAASATRSLAGDAAAGGSRKAEAPTAVPDLLLVGDSMMRVGVGPALKSTLAAKLPATVHLHAKSATGLSRPDVYDWPAALRGLFAKRHFPLAIVMIGANDCQDLSEKERGAKGERPIPYGTDAWRTTYRSRVKAMVSLLCGGADKVLWLGLPPMRNNKFNRKVAELNQLVSSEIGASSCVRFVPVDTSLAGPSGSFAEYQRSGQDRRRQRIRDADGVHITKQGGLMLSDELLPLLK